MNSIITKNIRVLAYVSLLMDMASEMLYPIMPVYLKEIGFSVLAIGILEGIADATAGLSKGFFGQWSDQTGKRLPFVSAGYALSAVSKPLLLLFQSPAWVLLMRSFDRLGKGIRTAPRDAILASESLPQHRGAVFGYHRSMDTLGAVAGPSIALVFLYFNPGEYFWLFIFAAIPGLLSALLTRFVKENKSVLAVTVAPRPGFFDFFKYTKKASPIFKKTAFLLLLFALINSSDMLLLLRLKESGQSDTIVIGLYIFYNLVYAIFALPLGKLADKMGMGYLMATGMLLFGLVYIGAAFATQMYVFVLLFALYGIFAASTEGVGKALLSKLCAVEETGTAIGSFSAMQSICALLASSITGAIWWKFGHEPAFILSALLAVLCAVALIILTKKKAELR